MLRVFRSKPKYVTVKSQPANKREAADSLWARCEKCSTLIYNKELEKALHCCTNCGFHFRISSLVRLNMIIDDKSFKEFQPLVATNPLNFPEYEEKLAKTQETTKLDDAIIIGEAKIDGHSVVLGIIDFSFFGGSMGSVVGEQLTRGFEFALERQMPVVIFSGGGGGARMHEGIYSLMQMAKTSQAVGRFKQAGLLYISVLTDPTMGGIYASFASLGDIILAEPNALIGFAGPRIVKETTKQKLPSGFQTSEYALQHGMIDQIVPRSELRETVGKLLSYHI